jgi:hypothetical protein
MHGLAATDRSGAAGKAALYDAAATRRTYAHLLSLTGEIVKSGWPVIVDAAFLKMEERRQFRNLAGALGVPFIIFDLHAAEETLRKRVAARERENRDPSDAGVQVLLNQLAFAEPLAADEMADTIAVDTDADLDPGDVAQLCANIAAQLAADL